MKHVCKRRKCLVKYHLNVKFLFVILVFSINHQRFNVYKTICFLLCFIMYEMFKF